MKKVSTKVGFIIIAAEIIILFGGVFAWQYFALKQIKNPVMSQKMSVARQKQEIF